MVNNKIFKWLVAFSFIFAFLTAGLSLSMLIPGPVAGAECSFSIKPKSKSFSYSGGDGTVTVTASGDSCAWTAESGASWITLTSESSGTGSGDLAFQVSENDGSAGRNSYIDVSGKKLRIKQQARKLYKLSVSKAGSGSGTVTSSVAGIACGEACSEKFLEGTSLTLTAASDANSVFIGWQGAGCADQAACDITITKNVKVTAKFIPYKKPPVLIVPGVMGSTLSSAAQDDLYPVLPKYNANNPVPPSSLRVHNPEAAGVNDPVGVKALKETLEQDFTVFEAPYDWRMPLDSAYKKYLMPFIKTAKKLTGYPKVSIVAHSMGGLLTRAYIESDAYANDISKFIMVGTPNSGATNAFWILEGGDPKTVDDLTEPAEFSSVNFYSHVSDRMYYAQTGKHLFKKCSEVYGLDPVGLISCNSESPTEGLSLADPVISSKELRTFINQFGFKVLLPTFKFLSVDGVYKPDSTSNQWLEDLNTSSRLERLSPASGNDSSKVRTSLILSVEKKTFSVINASAVTDSNSPYYTIGYGPDITCSSVDNCAPNTGEGDGTVWEAGARIEQDQLYWDVLEGNYGAHNGLMGAAKDKISELLK